MRFERMENRAYEEADFNKAFRRAQEELTEDALEMRDFEDFYGQEEVARDLEFVARREENFRKGLNPEDKRVQEHALISEAIIHTQLELNDWLGPDAITIRSSRYDDIIHGVDEIIEFRPPQEAPSHLALAVDVTYSNAISEKLERIKGEIESGHLTKVKYFNPKEGGLDNVPRVVIQIDFKTLQELTEFWMEKDNDALYLHPAQLLILDQIQLQLEKFKKFAEEQEQEEIVKVYEDALETINGIIKGKRELRQQLRWDKDSNEVFSSMRRSIQNTFK